jgi:predicted naringenin-chalcone synthase
MAKSICASDTEARVLIVNAELCTVHFQQSEEMDMIVGNAIFADGVSAVLVSADENDSIGPKLNLRNFESRFIEESEKDMAWKIGETGFEMKLSAYVPRLIQKNIESILTGLLSRIGKTREDINIWAFHPGGRAILDKIRISLNLEPDDLAHSYETLKQYGNMSSATVFFVLKRILEDKTKQGPVFSAAFGPGLTVESALMEKV